MSDTNRISAAPAALGFVPFVLMMAALQAMVALGVDSMLPNLPAIGATFALPHENARQLVVTSYLIGFGGAQIIYGPFADRFGRKPVLLARIGLYVLFSALAAFAPSFQMLVAARALQGAGAAGARALPTSIIRDCFEGRRMAKVMSLSFMVFMGVPMLAPSLGQAIGLFASWRWVFATLSAYGALAGLWVLVKLPETLHPEDRLPIAPSTVAHSFVVTLKNRCGMGYAAAMTFLSGALFGFINSVQQLFQDVFHKTALFPLAFALMAGGMSVSSLLNARWVEKAGMRRLSHWALIAFILISSGHAILALTGRETVVAFAILQAATMFCFGLLGGNFGAMAMESLGHVAGSAASVQGALAILGGALMGLVIGQSFNCSAAPIVLGYATAGWMALACVLYAERGRLFHGPQGASAGVPILDVH